MTKGILRRHVIVGSSLTVAGGALGMHRGALAQEKTIRLGLQPAPILGYYVRDKKLLEKRGFKPEWLVLPFSPPIMEGMAGGSIDIGFLGVPPTLSTAMRNPGIWYFYDELAGAADMVVQSNSTIRGPADLKGKKIVFPGKASQQFAHLSLYLKGSGVKVSDVDLIRANAPDMTTLFKRKEVEGMLCWPPYTSELVRTGEARLLYSIDDLWKSTGLSKAGHWINAGWGVRADYAKKNEDAVLAVVEALHEARRALQERPDEVYAVFAKATGYTLDAVKFLVGNGYNGYFPPNETAPSVKSMTQIFRVLEEYGIVKGDGDVDAAMKELVHPEFVEKVLARTK
jgi:ABC-type nitrate/sulfonate/bicarbonate transport system substrate-binding protein